MFLALDLDVKRFKDIFQQIVHPADSTSSKFVDARQVVIFSVWCFVVYIQKKSWTGIEPNSLHMVFLKYMCVVSCSTIHLYEAFLETPCPVLSSFFTMLVVNSSRALDE